MIQTKKKLPEVDSFLTVPLYKALYEQFKGATLPPTSGLVGAMVTLGVGPKVKEKARQVFQRSAKQAGFFEFGNSRLVAPSIEASSRTEVLEERDEEEEEQKDKTKGRTAGDKTASFDRGTTQGATRTTSGMDNRRSQEVAGNGVYDLQCDLQRFRRQPRIA